jgi:hypothetical protein
LMNSSAIRSVGVSGGARRSSRGFMRELNAGERAKRVLQFRNSCRAIGAL